MVTALDPSIYGWVKTGEDVMKRAIITVFALAFATGALSSCGNTIRGMGQDTANTVNATQDAGNRVGNAAAK